MNGGAVTGTDKKRRCKREEEKVEEGERKKEK
jgi:hypothetical protein